jgi:catechol 2,3-dioxygenase-like lactoylglutathione lyase family enzyme
MRVEHLGIYARDTAKLADWYADTLGFEVVRTLEKEGRPPIFFMKPEEGWEIEILPTNAPPRERELSDCGYSHVGLIVDDFSEIQAKLESKGVTMHDVRQTSNGWTIGYFEDPEGNRLEAVYRPVQG